jgi:hypothetical protein
LQADLAAATARPASAHTAPHLPAGNVIVPEPTDPFQAISASQRAALNAAETARMRACRLARLSTNADAPPATPCAVTETRVSPSTASQDEEIGQNLQHQLQLERIRIGEEIPSQGYLESPNASTQDTLSLSLSQTSSNDSDGYIQYRGPPAGTGALAPTLRPRRALRGPRQRFEPEDPPGGSSQWSESDCSQPTAARERTETSAGGATHGSEVEATVPTATGNHDPSTNWSRKGTRAYTHEASLDDAPRDQFGTGNRDQRATS